jgi:iron complex transport system substrate-binding protein
MCARSLRVVRVVSLACSNTEIVCALGFSASLVGVDDHSDFPAEVVARLSRVGPDLGVDVERVARLEPDLVLASLTVPGHERIVEALERAGLPFIAPEPERLDDVYRDIRAIAQRLGAPAEGERVVGEMRAVLDTPPPRFERPPRVLVEWWPKPVIVPGRRSWVTDLIERSGGVNPFADRDVKSTPIDDDEAVASSADAVVISWCGVRTEKYHPRVVRRRERWRALPALAHDRITAVAEAYLGRPSPRLVDGYRALCEVVRAAAEDQSKGRVSASSI